MRYLFVPPFESAFTMVMWCFFIGVSLGLLYLFAANKRKARLVERFFTKNAFSEEEGLSFSELGFSSEGKAMKKVSLFAVEKNGKFFIPEAKKAKASFISRSGKTNPFVFIGAVILVYFAMTVLCNLLPELINIDINFV